MTKLTTLLALIISEITKANDKSINSIFLFLKSFLGANVPKKKQIIYIDNNPLNIEKTMWFKFIKMSFLNNQHKFLVHLIFF